MKKLIDSYFKLLHWLLIATVAILIIPVTLQIISRYTALIPSYIWTEELSRFLFIWMVMLGAMIAVREGTHLDVDLWPDLTPKANAVSHIIASLFVLIFSCVFIYWGFKFVRFGWNQQSELAELPMTFIFAAWPIAGLTWAIFVGEALVADIRILTAKDPQ
ncbi:MAG: TRAP transporter small permease [Alphaproteobacteria bacterium]|nr:TRAP transporter small permease [Alphaproteobacteria bacterium]